jgi:hypothetical protein
MKEMFVIIGTALAVVGLIILQLKILKKHHPNAELLIGLFRILEVRKKPLGNKSKE